MEDRRDHRPELRPSRADQSPSDSSWSSRLRRLWTPGVRIRVILLAICLAAFAKFGIAEGTGSVMLIAGLMLLVPWFLNSLVTALRLRGRSDPIVRRRTYLSLLLSGLVLAGVALTAWLLIPPRYTLIAAGVGFAFFLLHALTQPWLRRRTG